MNTTEWDRSNPYMSTLEVKPEHTDRLGHTNNVAYLEWMEDISWQHIETIGMGWDVQEREGKAMAIVRTEVDYLHASYADDRLVLATWITESDDRLFSARHFQMVRAVDGKTIMRAQSRYVCILLASGKPCRMPKAFVEGHRKALQVHATDPGS
ncbi:MAG: thioesterase [Moraxellaceae bacterium]|nr:MAG: thioesterase [Moraxellaceae bacterium]